MRKLVLLAFVALAAVVLPTAEGATPAAGTVSTTATSTSWTGGPFLVPNPSGVCVGTVTPGCDTFSLTIAPPASGTYSVNVAVSPSTPDDDYDLYVYRPDGAEAGNSATASGSESVTLDNPAAGTYSVVVVAFMINPGDTYQGTAKLTVAPPPVANDPTSVQWSFDPSKPQESAEVPLRIVMVGFKPGEIDESKILGQVPNYQQPGVLIPRGEASSPDNADFPAGADTLVNHGRAYYDNVKPFLVPYE
jgi:hypothetical protein